MSAADKAREALEEVEKLGSVAMEKGDVFRAVDLANIYQAMDRGVAVAQVHATLAVAEQQARIADALELVITGEYAVRVRREDLER